MAAVTGVALVGAGYWGQRLARNLASASGCELRVVCDHHAERARAVVDAFGGMPASSLTDALTDDAVGAVVLATPSATHASLVTEALASSRHVLVEKPLASCAADAALLAARAAERGLVVMCDQTYRFAPAVAAIGARLADPAFGPLMWVESCRTNRGHDQPDVDVFWDLAYHDLAIVDAVVPAGLRGTVEVSATAQDVRGRGRAHCGELTLDFAAGPRARITVDWHAATKLRAMRFASAAHEVTWDDADVPVVRHDERAVPVAAAEPLAAVVAEFLAAVAERRPATCGPAQELPILIVLAAASESAAHGGTPVPVDLADRAGGPADDDTAVVA
ncbi:MAG TPA: Gfo/Idh/MocA family oxidoreductase [Acidimicrobiia bacterium]|jgi:predicted dehydrogenase|nr:Gfo/Idh/MocA family oxidoreductase [Acidimicrobiia bacterium]